MDTGETPEPVNPVAAPGPAQDVPQVDNALQPENEIQAGEEPVLQEGSTLTLEMQAIERDGYAYVMTTGASLYETMALRNEEFMGMTGQATLLACWFTTGLEEHAIYVEFIDQEGVFVSGYVDPGMVELTDRDTALSMMLNAEDEEWPLPMAVFFPHYVEPEQEEALVEQEEPAGEDAPENVEEIAQNILVDTPKEDVTYTNDTDKAVTELVNLVGVVEVTTEDAAAPSGESVITDETGTEADPEDDTEVKTEVEGEEDSATLKDAEDKTGDETGEDAESEEKDAEDETGDDTEEDAESEKKDGEDETGDKTDEDAESEEKDAEGETGDDIEEDAESVEDMPPFTQTEALELPAYYNAAEVPVGEEGEVRILYSFADYTGVLLYRVYGVVGDVEGFFEADEEGNILSPSALDPGDDPFFHVRVPAPEEIPEFYMAVDVEGGMAADTESYVEEPEASPGEDHAVAGAEVIDDPLPIVPGA